VKTLVLARHAKSSWDEPDLEDEERPLNERGEHDAPRMARRLAGTGVRPEAIVSSTARRALTTAQFFAEELGVDVESEPRLYGASPATIAEVVAERGLDSVLVVAHDPGLSVLAGRFAAEIVHMPTCAVATFTWTDHVDSWETAFASAPTSWRFDAPRLS